MRENDKLFISGYVVVDNIHYASIVILGISDGFLKDHIGLQATGYSYSRLSHDNGGNTRLTAGCATTETGTLIGVHYMSSEEAFSTTSYAV